MAKRIAASLLLVFGVACSDAPTGCTLAPCLLHGLLVQFTTPPTGPFRVEARARPGGPGATYVYDCPDASRCVREAMFEAFTPFVVDLAVTYGGRSATYTLQPTYSTTYPNGRRCGPECRGATVRVALP